MAVVPTAALLNHIKAKFLWQFTKIPKYYTAHDYASQDTVNGRNSQHAEEINGRYSCVGWFKICKMECRITKTVMMGTTSTQITWYVLLPTLLRKFLLHFQNLAYKVSFQCIHLNEQAKCGGSFTPVNVEFPKPNLGKEGCPIHTSFPISQFRLLGPFL